MVPAVNDGEPARGDAHELKRALGLRDLVLFNLVAVAGLRWLATAAKAGPASLALWVLAGLFFFVPQGLVVIELSSRFPEEGGIYQRNQPPPCESEGFMGDGCSGVNDCR